MEARVGTWLAREGGRAGRSGAGGAGGSRREEAALLQPLALEGEVKETPIRPPAAAAQDPNESGPPRPKPPAPAPPRRRPAGGRRRRPGATSRREARDAALQGEEPVGGRGGPAGAPLGSPGGGEGAYGWAGPAAAGGAGR